MSFRKDLYAENDPREFVLAHSKSHQTIHLVPVAEFDYQNDDDPVLDREGRAECSFSSTFSAVSKQSKEDHDPEDLCVNCFRTALGRNHLDDPAPFTEEDLRL